MSSHQRECRSRVIETCSPIQRSDFMALDAIRRKAGGSMRRRSRGNERCAMAADTINRNADVLLLSSILVARLALKRNMSPEKRETGRLVLLLHVGNLPGTRRMTAHAISAKLALVNIGMARNAIRRLTLRELQSLMT